MLSQGTLNADEKPDQTEKAIFSHTHQTAADNLIYPKSCAGLYDGNITVLHDESITVWNPETATWIDTIYKVPDISYIKTITSDCVFGATYSRSTCAPCSLIHLDFDKKQSLVKRYPPKEIESPFPADIAVLPSGSLVANLVNGIQVNQYTITAPTEKGIFRPTALSDKCLIGFREENNSVFIFDIENKKFVRDARLRNEPFNSLHPEIAVLEDQKFAMYFHGESKVEIYKMDYDFKLTNIGSIKLDMRYPKKIVSLISLLNGIHLVLTYNEGTIHLLNTNTLKFEDQLTIPSDQEYKGIICMRPTDGQLVYVTPSSIGMIQYSCTVNYLRGIRSCQYLLDAVNTLPADNIQIIGEYIYPNKQFVQTIKQNKAKLGFFDSRKKDPNEKVNIQSEVLHFNTK